MIPLFSMRGPVFVPDGERRLLRLRIFLQNLHAFCGSEGTMYLMGIRKIYTVIALSVVFCGAVFSGNAAETPLSPYVAERQKDPVNWRAWNEETRAALLESGKPGLFSIGHELNALARAMGEQSFRNKEIARQINEGFFPVAVDKNEHPQLSEFFALYVRNAKQATGWPLTVITTPGLEPIDGGGYYPPTDDWGSQGISSVLEIIHEQWEKNQPALTSKSGRAMSELTLFHGPGEGTSTPFRPEYLKLAVENLEFQFDPVYGGFSLPPKAVTFRPVHLLDLAISQGNSGVDNLKTMRDSSLRALLHGGVRDYVRGGFFAAATEESWTIPDFRKLAGVQVDAIRYLKSYPEYSDVVEETAKALVEDFRNELGLYSGQIEIGAAGSSASDPHAWSWTELSAILSSDELEAFSRAFAVEKEGNISEDLAVSDSLKGANILKRDPAVPAGPLVQSAVTKLKRFSFTTWPSRKEEVSSVTTNALVASALLDAGEPFFQEAADLLENINRLFWDTENSRLRAAVQSGRVKPAEASSAGYASYIRALLDAHGKLKEARYLDRARELQSVLDQRFGTEHGPYRIASEENGLIPPLLAFVEDGTGSANAFSLRNLKVLDEGRLGLILNHLPEEISYAPEQYPELLAAGLAVNP